MLTYAKVKKLLSPGDTIFTVEVGQLIKHIVKKIFADSLYTDEDYFFYDDVGELWFLTSRGALDSIRNLERKI